MNTLAPVKPVAKAMGLALSIVLLLSGCSLAADITTSEPYAPSDGVRAEVGGVLAQNLLVITPAEGEEAVLVGSLTNTSNARVGVVLSRVGGDGESVTVLVDADATERLGTAPGRTLLVATSQVSPGAVSAVRIAVGDEAVTVSIPVVDGTLPEYQAVLDRLEVVES